MVTVQPLLVLHCHLQLIQMDLDKCNGMKSQLYLTKLINSLLVVESLFERFHV